MRKTMALLFVLVSVLKSFAGDGGLGDYKIAPQDILSIDVYNEKDLTKENLRVSANGEISFPLLTTVKVAGKTPAELETLLEKLLGDDYLVDPHVIVTVRQYKTRTMTVMGEVNKPSSIELPAEQKLTIVDVIAKAGGLTPKASDSKILYTHDGKTETYTLKELKKQNPGSKGVIYVEENDIVEVKASVI